jgi:hypothetical protein
MRNLYTLDPNLTWINGLNRFQKDRLIKSAPK